MIDIVLYAVLVLTTLGWCLVLLREYRKIERRRKDRMVQVDRAFAEAMASLERISRGRS